MMEQFFSNRKITDELAEYDEKVVDLYMVRPHSEDNRSIPLICCSSITNNI